MSESGYSPKPTSEDLSVMHPQQVEPGIGDTKQDGESLKLVREVGFLLAAETNSGRLQNHLNILRDTMTPAEPAQTLAIGVRGGGDTESLAYSMNFALDAVAGAFGRAR